MSQSIHGMWSSRLIFIFAASGSAIGLGNIWRFPYIAGENGGGFFVLVYLACILLIGVPIMASEILLGRAGRKSPINTMQDLTQASGVTASWQAIGWVGAIAGFTILSYYGVVAGWVLFYLLEMSTGGLVNANAQSTQEIFTTLTANPWALVGWQTLFMVMATYIAALGVVKGLQTAVKYMMPALYILLVMLVVWAATESGHFQESLTFLFSFRVEAFSVDALLAAMGHAFFTLSIGMGAIMAYGAYLPKGVSIIGASVTIAMLDTIVALLSALIIFPIVFANGLEGTEGPSLMFLTLPIAFANMPGGQFFGTLFFLLVSFAAITSAISLLEPVTAWLVERLRTTRAVSAMIVGFMAWLLGLGSAFSFNIMSDVHFFPGMTFFNLVDFASDKILLPVGGVLIALFTGWALRQTIIEEELGFAGYTINIWQALIRYIAPVAVGIVFVMKLQTLFTG